MITDARVLDPKFVPQDVVHRDGQINHLTSTLKPIMDGEAAEPSFLYGPSGTGKTCIARYALDRLRKTIIDVETQYVNCWDDHTRYTVLYRLLEGLDKTFDIHRQSTPTDVLLDRLRDYDGPPYIVILDKADQLQDKALLYELHRIPKLSMVLIANDDDELFMQVRDRVRSRLQTSERIHFSPCSPDELTAILQDRVRLGLEQDVITDEQIGQITGAAAGDARVALGVLRVAAKRARRNGSERIDAGVVERAVSEAKTEIEQQILDKLTTDQTILYDIITEHEEISPSVLYDEYRDRASNPRSERMVRNYLSKLVHYNLIEAAGKNLGRVYRASSNQ